MGMVLGKISEEMPNHKVVYEGEGFEVWRYPSSVAAIVRADAMNADNPPTGDKFTSEGFRILARYIGVFSKPENEASAGAEKVAMTAPVVMTPPSGESEKIAMTVPVVITLPSGEAEKIAMTAPVVMTPPSGESEKIAMTAPVVMSPPSNESENIAMKGGRGESMAFLLPSKYSTVEEAPKPTNPAVSIELMPPRYEAVLQFSGNFPSNDASKRQAKVKELLELMQKAEIEPIGQYTIAGYNPPFTLPWLKRNEIHIPVDGSKYEE